MKETVEIRFVSMENRDKEGISVRFRTGYCIAVGEGGVVVTVETQGAGAEIGVSPLNIFRLHDEGAPRVGG